MRYDLEKLQDWSSLQLGMQWMHMMYCEGKETALTHKAQLIFDHGPVYRVKDLRTGEIL
jgi:hypothetical protein